MRLHDGAGAAAGVGSRLTVSVILPTFDRVTYIGAAIDSLLEQTRRPDEIVVVDDGSTDGTGAAVARFGDAVRYVRQENSGKLAAISAGLDRVKGDLVWVMDDDDIAPPTALAALSAPFENDPGLAFSYGRMETFSELGGRIVPGEMTEYPTEDPRPFFAKLLEDCFVTGHPCVLVRRIGLEKLRPFDLSVTSSVDYYLHLGITRRGRTAFVDEVVLRQRQHEGARGSVAARHTAGERADRWQRADRRLVEPLLHDMELGEFIGVGGALTAAECRLALIQRSVVAARKGIWRLAIASLQEAAELCPGVPLEKREIAMFARLLGSRYGPGDVYSERWILAELREAILMFPDAPRLLAETGRPLLHQMKIAARKRSGRLMRDALLAWLRLMDMRAAARAIRGSLGRNTRRLVRGQH